MTVIGNLISIHIVTGRSDIAVLNVHADSMGGLFNVKTKTVTIGGEPVVDMQAVVYFITSRERVTAKVDFAPNNEMLITREANAVDLVTAD